MNVTRKILSLTAILTAFASIAFGQANCSIPNGSSGVNLIRGEGTAEQVAQLTFVCTAFANSAAAGTIDVQVFLSPALPVTSKVLNAATGATETLIQVNGQTPGNNTGAAGSVQGTVNGSTVIFVGLRVPALLPGASYTVVVSNVRVNASLLSIGAGIPPAISESLFISGASVVPTALNGTVAFAQNGLGSSGLRKVFTTGAGAPGTATGWPFGASAISGANNFAVCNAYSPVADNVNITFPGAASGRSLAFVVGVTENFASAFMAAGAFSGNGGTGAMSSEQSQIGVTSGTANSVITGTRFQVGFSNVPANVRLFVPNGRMASTMFSNAAAQLTQAAPGAAFAPVIGTTDTAVTVTGLAPASSNSLAQVSISAGAGSAVFEIVAGDPLNLDRFDIPVYIVTTANTVPYSATPIGVSVSLNPIAAVAIPNFVISNSTTLLSGSTFSGCNVPQTIMFPAPTGTSFGAPVTLNATATSALPVSYASNSPSVCTVSGSTVTLLTAGACSITASQAGDGTYAPALPVTQTFTVIPPIQTITFTQPADAILGSGTVPLSATATSALSVSFASTIPAVCTVNGSTVTLVSVGTCAVTATQAGNDIYAAATPVTRTFAVLAPANLVTLTVSNGAGTNGRAVELRIAIAATGSAAPAGFQMDLGFDPAKLSFISTRVGEQSTAAGKNVFSSTLPNGQIRMLVSGVNQNVIPPGAAAYASFQITGGFTSGTSPIAAANCASTDTAGNPLFTSCTAGLIKYASCDINGDANTNVSDVQLIINEALGVIPSTHDLNSDGLVTVADVQIVINAALGLGCNSH